jgi:hypothetical protein
LPVESARNRGIAESINESSEKQVRYLQGRVAESDVNKIFTVEKQARNVQHRRQQRASIFVL